ncbi:MAG: hypothetical protein QXN66_02620 [Thermoplasmatales archaeon]
MSGIDLLSRKLGIEKANIRLSYQIVGKALILKELPTFVEDEKVFADAIRSSLRLWSVYSLKSIEGEVRKPNTTLLSGIGCEIEHHEDGIIYRFDPSKLMFSKGNKKERHRLSNVVGKDEIVLDMFAGIGYFSIPLSLKARTVYAAEINPDAFHYLLVNKRLNGAMNLKPMLCDSSKIDKLDFADRIIMGHFSSLKYLQHALRYLKRRGEIHIHLLVRRGESENVSSILMKVEGVKDVAFLKVKEFSPRIDHMVFDVSVKKN